MLNKAAKETAIAQVSKKIIIYLKANFKNCKSRNGIENGETQSRPELSI